MENSKAKWLSLVIAIAFVFSLIPMLAVPQTALADPACTDHWVMTAAQSLDVVKDSDGVTPLKGTGWLTGDIIQTIWDQDHDTQPGISEPGPDGLPTDPDDVVLDLGYIGQGGATPDNGEYYTHLGMPGDETGRYYYFRAWNGYSIEEATYWGDLLDAEGNQIYKVSETYGYWPLMTNPGDYWHTTNPKPAEPVFTIEGEVFEADGVTPYNDPLVEVTNLNTSDSWDATVTTGTNDYSLELTGDDIPSVNDTIYVLARKSEFAQPGEEDWIGFTENVVTQDQIDNNGVSGVDVNLDHYYLSYSTYPYTTWEDPNWSGETVMWMCLKHYEDALTAAGLTVPDQSTLNTKAHTDPGYNAHPEPFGYVDATGIEDTLNEYVHQLSPRRNYSMGHQADEDTAINRIAYWQYLGPGAVPAYGDFSNWMAVRGIHTDTEPSYPYTDPSWTVYGFWMNDPNPDGIGENSYKTVGQWKDTYYQPIDDDGYAWDDEYVTVLEPPEGDMALPDNLQIVLADSPARFDAAVKALPMEKKLAVDGIEGMVEVRAIADDESLKIVQAAIDGVTEQLIPYDAEFAGVFAETVPGQPLLVSNEGGDYYLVPFNEPMKVKPVPRKALIERIVGKTVEKVKALSGRVEIQPISIEPILITDENTRIVVIVDAEDGSFQEASWVKEPVKYLRVSKADALRLVFQEMAVEPFAIEAMRALPIEQPEKMSAELVGTDGSPYHPDGKVTIGDKVFFVDQDGNVRS